MIGNMRFLFILNGHELIQSEALGCTIAYDHSRQCHTLEAISTMNLIGYLSQYPAVRFIDSRPAVIEVINVYSEG